MPVTEPDRAALGEMWNGRLCHVKITMRRTSTMISFNAAGGAGSPHDENAREHGGCHRCIRQQKRNCSEQEPRHTHQWPKINHKMMIKGMGTPSSQSTSPRPTVSAINSP